MKTGDTSIGGKGPPCAIPIQTARPVACGTRHVHLAV